MAKTFRHAIKTKPVDVIAYIKDKLANTPEIQFEGNEESGHVKGKGYEGKYSMNENLSGTVVEITIVKKPFIHPWFAIKSKIEDVAKKW